MYEPLLPQGANGDTPGRKLEEYGHLPGEFVAFEAGCSVVKPEAGSGQGSVPSYDGPGVEHGQNHVDDDVLGPLWANKEGWPFGDGEGVADLFRLLISDLRAEDGYEPRVYIAG